MKICSMSLIIREMQIKTRRLRYHFTPCWNGYHQSINQQTKSAGWRLWREGIPFALLVGMQIGTATMENSMEIAQKIKNGAVL